MTATPPPQTRDAPEARTSPDARTTPESRDLPGSRDTSEGGGVPGTQDAAKVVGVPGGRGAAKVADVPGGRGAVGGRVHRDGGRGPRRLLGPVLLLAVWQVAASTGLLDERTLAGPLAVAQAARDLVADGTLQENLWISLGRAGAGLASGVAVGAALAALSGLSRLGEDLIDGPMRFLRALPILAVIPLATVWFGGGEPLTIILVASGAAFPVYVTTHTALRGVDPRHVELARTVGLDRRALVRRVILPGALPGFFTGLRLSVAIAWLVLAVGEQLNVGSGLGFLTNQARTDVIVVGLLVYALLGLVSNEIVGIAERRVLRWRPSSAAS